MAWDSKTWINEPLDVIGPDCKFKPDGSVRKFRGTTIISFVPEGSPLGRCAMQTRDIIADTSAARGYAFLPPSSYHMTIIELLNENGRQADLWSQHLSLDCPLEKVDDFMLSRIKTVEPLAGSIEMRFRNIRAYNGLSIQLDPANSQTDRALRAYRDRVSAATGVRRPDHDEYVFHIGLGYRIAKLDHGQTAELETALQKARDLLAASRKTFLVDAPQLTFFNDMFEFCTHRISR